MSAVQNCLEYRQTESHILCTLGSLDVCSGHPDEHFMNLANAKFLSSSGDLQAYVDHGSVQINGTTYIHSTVRTQRCHILVCGAAKCSCCVSYQPTLRCMYHRWRKVPFFPTAKG